MSQQAFEKQVKDGYDQLPYPGIDSNMNPAAAWGWVNPNWIGSLLPFTFNGPPPFKRILIAACGTGNEAFQMRNSFPNAEIIAVDYSEQAICIAKAYQKEHPEFANIKFEVGDLTVFRGDWAKSNYYDFISCHGTMSSIPNAQKAFDVLAESLSPEGILYLGVNGSNHYGIAVRESFKHFGHNPNHFEDTLETRRLIELFDRLRPSQEHISSQTSTYLQSDILTAFNLNLSLPEWIEYANKSGLHFISNTELIPNLIKTLSPKIFTLLVPKSKEYICKLIEINAASGFHRIIFSKKPEPSLPWDNLETLLDYGFQTTQLYVVQDAVSELYGEHILTTNMIPGYDTSLNWPFDEVTNKLLNQTGESTRIKDVLANHLDEFKNDEQTLIVKLFMFYQLGIIKILPTASSTETDKT